VTDTGYVLDDTLIRTYAGGDNKVAHLLASLDAQPARMAMSAIALAQAQASLSDEQCVELNGVILSVEHLDLSPLATPWDATELSRIIAALGDIDDVAAAHTVLLSKTLDFPIVTADLERWRAVTDRLPWHLDLFALIDP
jgi:hypothetical protein